MARYIDADALKTNILMKYKWNWEVPCSTEDRIIQRVVTDMRVLIEGSITEDVVPRNENKWISCKDRMPNDMETVLVWFEYFRYGNHNRPYRTYGLSYAFRGNWSGFINGSSGYRGLKIFAWQPLPDKPIIE